MSDLLLSVRGLCKYFPQKGSEPLKAVDGVEFDVCRGETMGIVGESGSGKTTAARCILRAMDPTAGSAKFTNNGRTVDLATLSARELKPLRREMQMIFQDPYSSLNPRMTVGQIVTEPLTIHGIGTRKERAQKVSAMLERVGLSASHAARYPHAFSGGQRQRVGIARALILRPALVVADESVSALDVSVRARVLQLLAGTAAGNGRDVSVRLARSQCHSADLQSRDRDVQGAGDGERADAAGCSTRRGTRTPRYCCRRSHSRIRINRSSRCV